MLRSLKLMECNPAGQSTPAAHGLKKLYKKYITNCPPFSKTGEVVYAFTVTRGARTKLTRCTVHTKGIGLFTTNYLNHNNSQPHCTRTLTPSLPATLLAYHSSPPPEFWCPEMFYSPPSLRHGACCRFASHIWGDVSFRS